MTTICCDGQTIAADGRAVSGGNILSETVKKLVVDKGVIFAFCGAQALIPTLIAWFHAGADPATAPKLHEDYSWAMLVITKDGPARYVCKLPYPDPIDYPFADGTGHDIAWAAMAAGKSPAEAIAISARRDVATGGEIQVINVADALGLRPKRATVRAFGT